MSLCPDMLARDGLETEPVEEQAFDHRHAPETREHDFAQERFKLRRVHQRAHLIDLFAVDGKGEVGVRHCVDTFVDGVRQVAVDQEVGKQVVQFRPVSQVGQPECAPPGTDIVHAPVDGTDQYFRMYRSCFRLLQAFFYFYLP